MRLEISRFGGMAPVVDPTALAENLAELAKNVRFDRGVLTPGYFTMVPAPAFPDADLQGSGVKAVARVGNTRFAFTDADAATAFPSPVAPADKWGRVYFNSYIGPSFTTTGQYSPGSLAVNPVSFRLGVPAPSSRATIGSVTIDEQTEKHPDGGETTNEPDWVTVAYVYSYVDSYGHEGPLSGPTGPVTLAYDRTFSVEVNVSASPPNNVDFTNGLRRVYRATTSDGTGAWQFIGEVPIATLTFVDTLPIGDESEEAINEDWYPAPSGLEQLCLVASAYAAGFQGHYVHFSELKLPHAWPPGLQYPLKYRPKRLVPMMNGLFIATDGRPYWAEGSDPWSAIPRELPINAPCLSADSVVDMGGYAMYLSQEGVVMSTGSDAQLVSEGFLGRGDIAELVDADSKAFRVDDWYVFSTLDNRWMGFHREHGLVEYDFGFLPSAFSSVRFSVQDNLHYFALRDGRVRRVQFNSGMSGGEWHSKYWRTPVGTFSCVRVEANQYPIDITVRSKDLSGEWEDHVVSIQGPYLHRLPVFVGHLWQVRVRLGSADRVFRIIVAQSGSEAA